MSDKPICVLGHYTHTECRAHARHDAIKAERERILNALQHNVDEPHTLCETCDVIAIVKGEHK